MAKFKVGDVTKDCHDTERTIAAIVTLEGVEWYIMPGRTRPDIPVTFRAENMDLTYTLKPKYETGKIYTTDTGQVLYMHTDGLMYRLPGTNNWASPEFYEAKYGPLTKWTPGE